MYAQCFHYAIPDSERDAEIVEWRSAWIIFIGAANTKAGKEDFPQAIDVISDVDLTGYTEVIANLGSHVIRVGFPTRNVDAGFDTELQILCFRQMKDAHGK